MTDNNTKSTVVSGWEARSLVQERKLFRNNSKTGNGPKYSTLWGEWLGDLYVVYSYGRHWPLWINWKGVWFGNIDRYGRTTTKHFSQTHPLTGYVPMSKLEMEHFVLFGQPEESALVEAAQLKLLPDELVPLAVKARIAA